VPRALALASVLPSGLNATDWTAALWPGVGADLAVGGQVPPALPSTPPLARVSCRLNATELTSVLLLLRGAAIWRWVARSHADRATALLLARVLPSGLNATE
jgi:hypothetical protein